MKKYFALVFYLISIFLFFEISSRIFLHFTTIWVEEDTTWLRDWIKQREKISRLTWKKFDIYDATKGWYSKSNIDTSIRNEWTVKTNSRGIRSNFEYAYKKNHNKSRILIIGDSYTFGEGVSDNETFPYQLQEMLPDYEIINMGIHGYGHDQILILLQEEGVKYEPDIVILGYVDEDMDRNLLNFRSYAKPRYIVQNEKLKLTGVPVHPPEYYINRDFMRMRIYDIYSILLQLFKEYSGIYKIQKEIITKYILDEIVNVSTNANAIAIFVYIPEYKEVYTNHLTGEKDFYSRYCKNNKNVTCISSMKTFKHNITKGIKISKAKHGHWNPLGYKAIAETTYSYLLNKENFNSDSELE